MDRLEVPYLIVDTDGVVVHVSRHLSELFPASDDLTAVVEQSGHVAASVCRTQSVVTVPCCRGEMRLAGDLFDLSPAERLVLVVCTPSRRVTTPRPTLESAGLTVREEQVAWLLAEGRTSKGIGEALRISTHTARHHTERILAKLGVSSRAEAAALLGRWSTGSRVMPPIASAIADRTARTNPAQRFVG
jgi:DNA-binding CsgD family transcriptional regulator